MVKYRIIPFSEKEDDYLIKNFSKYTDRLLAINLGRSYDAVKKRREFLGLQKKTSKYNQAYQSSKKEIEDEIAVLVNFIEVTTSDVWREIANTKRKMLLKTLKY